MTEIIPQLDQDKTWTTAKGVTIPIEEMDPHHLSNTIRYLDRHAQQLKFTLELQLAFGPQPSGDLATEAVDMVLDQLSNTDSTAWLHDTPLYKRMVEVQEARATA